MLSGTKNPNTTKKAGINVVRNGSAICDPSSAFQRSRRNGSSGSGAMPGIREEGVEDDQDDAEQDDRRLDEAEDAADDLVGEARFSNSGWGW